GVIIGEEVLQAETKLMQIAYALNLLGLSLGTGNHREQQRSQNSDDGDDHKEFDQREAARIAGQTIPGRTDTSNIRQTRWHPAFKLILMFLRFKNFFCRTEF